MTQSTNLGLLYNTITSNSIYATSHAHLIVAKKPQHSTVTTLHQMHGKDKILHSDILNRNMAIAKVFYLRGHLALHFWWRKYKSYSSQQDPPSLLQSLCRSRANQDEYRRPRMKFRIRQANQDKYRRTRMKFRIQQAL